MASGGTDAICLQVTAFNMVDLLRERMASDESPEAGDPLAAAGAAADELATHTERSDQRRSNAEHALTDTMAAKIITGEPYSERKSTFQVRRY